MPEALRFYDLKKKKKFVTSNYRTFTKKVRGRTVKFAKTTAPSGSVSTRIISNKK